MTSEVRTSVDLNDIAGIEIGCPKCFGSTVLPIAHFNEVIPARCVNCQEPLIAHVGQEQIRTLIRALGVLSASNDALKANIRIQVKPIRQSTS